MRDPGRIDELLKTLESVWKRHPDQRFGQLVANIFVDEVPHPCPEFFFLEDYNALQRIRQWQPR